MWRSDTKPTPANIRRRIASALEATDAAMDLVKANPKFGKAQLQPLNDARLWLIEANRRTLKP